MSDTAPDSPAPVAEPSGQYVVVARRYRPQTFNELIGQQHVGQALSGAITSDRVGHAYLFTGARGVGKTSAARILAKALNCVAGPSPQPCNECELCTSVGRGSDVDVLEIDGASNRGIDEIRQLRQNVAVRPSRARYKIYIIDEVHMLTKEAFNALLKTLEEPPEHVKFIFATTEPNKIPVTILSRCQRFDFAGIEPAAIQERLRQIAAAEGVEAEEEALQLLAVRAGGSMRDSQSLLEQLLATGTGQLAVGDVTELLGIAPAARLSRMVQPLADGDAATALAELDAAITDGAEPGQLIDQLLGYFRDVMTQAAGCDASQMLYALPAQHDEIRDLAARTGLANILAIIQILDQTIARLRLSTQSRTLAEMALVRITQLGDLETLASVIQQVKSDGAGQPLAPTRSPAAPPSPSAVPAREAPRQTPPEASTANAPPPQPPTGATPAAPGASAAPSVRLDATTVAAAWQKMQEQLTGMLAGHAAHATATLNDKGQVVATFPANFSISRDACERNVNRSKIEAALAAELGGAVSLVLATDRTPVVEASASPRPPTRRQQQATAATHPFVVKAMELFEADESKLRYVPPEHS